ncbi:hypothetical protein [Marinimicrobium sp. C2-29]|uniref:hypothetical protein n=1 Tax=Marinimicrobium sp. C2-29 TaxID=3139825 RepID=UPI003138BFBF
MTELYILQNQEGLFLGKQKDWLDGRDRGALYKTPHRDEAVNLKVEVSAKDFEQRITIHSCQTDERGLPVIGADAVSSGPVASKAAEVESSAEESPSADAPASTTDDLPPSES